MIDTSRPFVLLDDARAAPERAPRLYRDPVACVVAHVPGEITAALAALRAAGESGLHAAGFIGYDAGHAMEPRLGPRAHASAPDAPPLLWFGLFERAEEIASDWLADGRGAWTSAARPLIERATYEAAVGRVKAHIEAGDIYQANLSFQAEVDTLGHPRALYASIRARAAAGHGGIVHTGDHWLLSFSPELFFTVEQGRIATRPMKGTAERGVDAAADRAAIERLRADPKQRAENLMIVDLLRNDLARVSEPGSVQVPSLFEIETYPTVHQMTSTVTGALAAGVDAVAVLEALFPCGSITGAPKIRAMEIVANEESGPRGIYTGSIGSLAPGGDARFNVAIRTLVLRDGENRATIGLGSGIVADSEASAEWRECLAKGAFVTGSSRRFDLIETMRFDPREGLAELDRHLARMKRSAEALGFPFDRHAARNDLHAATFRLSGARKLRLLLSQSGRVAIESRPLPPAPAEPVAVRVVPLPVERDDFRLRHKTSDRDFYNEARSRSGRFEILFEDRDGYLTEGSFTHIFVARDGRLLTPPLARGLLPGILREQLIDDGEAEEAELRVADLADGFFIGNAVRGLMRALLIE